MHLVNLHKSTQHTFDMYVIHSRGAHHLTENSEIPGEEYVARSAHFAEIPTEN